MPVGPQLQSCLLREKRAESAIEGRMSWAGSMRGNRLLLRDDTAATRIR
jgi:hypothetical protein